MHLQLPLHRNLSMRRILITHMLFSMHCVLFILGDLSIWILNHMGFLKLWWRNLKIPFNLHGMATCSLISLIFLTFILAIINIYPSLNCGYEKPFTFVLIVLTTNFYSKMIENLSQKSSK